MDLKFVFTAGSADYDDEYQLEGTVFYIQHSADLCRYLVIEDQLATKGSIKDHGAFLTLDQAKSAAIKLSEEFGI